MTKDSKKPKAVQVGFKNQSVPWGGLLGQNAVMGELAEGTC